MSVDVKTPTRTQFEHSEFPCGEYKQSPSCSSSSSVAVQRIVPNQETSFSNGKESIYSPAPIKKRKSTHQYYRSMSVNARMLPIDDKPPPKRRKSTSQKKEFKLPSKFLLGGNINDPLNLISLCEDEDLNRELNAVTPKSSPLPFPPYRQQVNVIIPPNINDPLNLNAPDNGEDVLVSPKNSRKKHKRNKHRKKSEKGDDGEMDTSAETTGELLIDVNECNNPSRVVDDRIVSPVCPQTSPRTKRSKRKSDDGKPDPSSAVSRALGWEGKPEKQFFPSRQNSKHGTNNRERNGKFIYGNYTRYYGYRNADVSSDIRLTKFRNDWFEGRQVLDIGCNVGHVTLEIAKKYNPSKVIGMDIDRKLVAAARNNIHHYVSSESSSGSKFPTSMPLCYGPVTAPPVSGSMDAPKFPNNVMFIQGDYVLESDELLVLQKEEYDTILALSVTKWMHVTHGDDGLKRAFRRMFRQLRPGGKLILEPQSWASYKKKKRLTEKIFKVFSSIRFRPEQFTEYLLSIGFSTCENLDTPHNKSKGFRRPIQVYTKSDTAYPSPNMTPASNTPQYQ